MGEATASNEVHGLAASAVMAVVRGVTTTGSSNTSAGRAAGPVGLPGRGVEGEVDLGLAGLAGDAALGLQEAAGDPLREQGQVLRVERRPRAA